MKIIMPPQFLNTTEYSNSMYTCKTEVLKAFKKSLMTFECLDHVLRVGFDCFLQVFRFIRKYLKFSATAVSVTFGQ